MTRITSDQYGYVTVTTDDDMGETHTTTYFCNRFSEKPSYVRVWDAAGRFPQVCELLSNRGNTLMATPESLERVIRGELRRAREHMKRERNAWA